MPGTHFIRKGCMATQHGSQINHPWSTGLAVELTLSFTRQTTGDG